MENKSKMLKSLLDERKNDSAQFIVCKKMSTQKKKLEWDEKWMPFYAYRKKNTHEI